MDQSHLDGFFRTVSRDNARPLKPGENMPKWKFDSIQAHALNRAVGEWVIRSGQHPSAIDGDGLAELLQLAEPRYVKPTAQYFKDVCYLSFFLRLALFLPLSLIATRCLVQVVFPDLYDKMKSIQMASFHHSSPHFESVSVPVGSSFVSPGVCLNPQNPISFTTDMWSGPDHEFYICLTVHWIDSQWNLHHALLDIYLCTDKHTGENLCGWMKDIWKGNDVCVRLCFSLSRVGPFAKLNCVLFALIGISAFRYYRCHSRPRCRYYERCSSMWHSFFSLCGP